MLILLSNLVHSQLAIACLIHCILQMVLCIRFVMFVAEYSYI